MAWKTTRLPLSLNTNLVQTLYIAVNCLAKMAKGANLTWYNVAICIIVVSGAFTYGFGFAVFVTSIGQPGFYQYFKLDRELTIQTTVKTNTTLSEQHLHSKVLLSSQCPPCADSFSILGAVNALFAFGAAVGAILQGWTADYLGRKKSLALSAVLALIGGALAAASVAIEMLIIVRILQGIGLGMIICQVPLYTTEVAPAHRRGLLSAMTVIGFGSGYTT
jgi:MFS family permease